jgi:hypothetical protein
VVLFLIVLALVQVPSIQKRLADYSISLITKKTHTRVELEKISIAFPKSVVIRGLYVEDTRKDTLLYAGEARINLSIRDLIHHEIHIGSFSLDDARIQISRVGTDSLFNFSFLVEAFRDTTHQNEVKPAKPTKWTFSLDHVNLKGIRASYTDDPEGIKATVAAGSLKVRMERTDLDKMVFIVDELRMEKSNGTFELREPSLNISADIGQLGLKSGELDLQKEVEIKIGKLNLEKSSVSYRTSADPEPKTTFDPENMEFKNVTLAATGIYYSTVRTEATVQNLQGTDQNNFSIRELAGIFVMDQHSISGKGIMARTDNSFIDADIGIQYVSLHSLSDSLESVQLTADMRKSSIMSSDISYFIPQLNDQPFLKNGLNVTTLTGNLDGTLNDLSGKNLVITTGTQTILKTDCTITGLPDFENADFNFPNLRIHSGRKDIRMLAGHYLPENIELPDTMSLQVVFSGRMKSFQSDLGLTSSFGAAHLSATSGPNEKFGGKISLAGFDLGKLLKDSEMFGPISLKADVSGKGYDKKTITAKIKAEVSQIYLNKYNYHELNIDGTVTGEEFKGKINLNDENAVFDFEGLMSMNPNQEKFIFHLNIPGADLKKLNLTDDEIQISLKASAEINGGKATNVNGKAGISNLIIAHKGKKYTMDSVLFATINEKGKSDFNFSSALIGIKYSGTFSPSALPGALTRFISNYFQFSDQKPPKPETVLGAFKFEIQLHNHPILSQVILPQLKELDPGLIQGSYDEIKKELKFDVSMNKIVYGTTEIKDFKIHLISDIKAVNYEISSSNISNSQTRLENFRLEGKLADQTIFVNLSSIDGKLNKKLLIRSKITREDGNYRFAADPKEFFLMNSRWDLAADHYIEFGKQGFLIHHLSLSKADSRIDIGSVHDRFQDDLNITLKNFKLDDLSRIIEKDTTLLTGSVDGNVLLKRVNNSYGIVADASIKNLSVREVPVGDLTLSAKNLTAGRFEIDAVLKGPDNDLTASGYYIPDGGDNSINIKADIRSLSMKTVEVLSMGEIREATGSLSGNFLVRGMASAPEITGELQFRDVFIKPAILNSRLELKNETIQFAQDGIHFNAFTLADVDQHTATINGTVRMEKFRNLVFDLQVNTDNFLLFNTTAKDNREFNGRMIIDSKIGVKGPIELPVIDARLKIRKGSNFTFAVPEDRLNTDKGEDVIEFTDTLTLNPILNRGIQRAAGKSRYKGVDVTSVIEIDNQATLRLLMDPASTDSLVVKGEAALSFTLDQSGKMTLTGAYHLNEGSYLVSLESIIKKKFEIVPGGTLIWNGDPLEADINIDAKYTVRASPYDLMADQLSGMSDVDRGMYKQRYPFLVLLKLRGEMMHPEISFEIQLPQDEKGILGGVVNQKLSMLNEDPSALNKQVFALLVLNRFVQENPLVSESGGTSTLVRSTVGKILSTQLNQLSSKIMPGMELNFDIQSFNDYQTGQAQGRTQLEVGMKKQLFNERLSIQVGGTVDVEGEKARQNTASDITGDLTLEYKLTKDGRYRLKAFRHNQYEGVIEGQLVETGAGFVYLRDFNKWKEILKRRKNRKNATDPTK